MSEEAQIVEEVEDIPQEVPQEPVELDLSAVPEKARDYVDVDKYQSDEAYKTAIENGWKPKELHEAEGGDEKDYTGYAQFVRFHERKQNEKALKEEMSEVRKMTEALVESFGEQKEKAVQEAIENLKAQQAEAVEDGETERAIALEREINNLEAPKEAPKPQGEPQVVLDFRAQNPVFDHKSPEFNPTMNAALEGIVNQQFMQMTDGGKLQLPESTMRMLLDNSLQQLQSDLKLNQPQRTAPKVQSPSKKSANVDPATQLTGSSKTMYNTILEKYGKDAADNFAASYVNGGE